MNSAALYLRYSTPEQAEGQSEQRQTQGPERWCKEHGEKLIKIYKDLGVSGGKSSDDRKGLSALLDIVVLRANTAKDVKAIRICLPLFRNGGNHSKPCVLATVFPKVVFKLKPS